MNEPSAYDIRNKVLERINPCNDLSKSELYSLIDDVIYEDKSYNYLSFETVNSLRHQVYDSIYGLDVLQEYLDDDSISEIMVNGYDNIFIERNGRIEKVCKHFDCPQKLIDTIQHIVALANRRINEAAPITDSRLPDGSRVNIVLSPISIDGPAITIRKFPNLSYTMDDLISMGSISKEAATLLQKLVVAGYNIFISGGTGSGKTTFLNILSNFIPQDERIITIEDSAELQIKKIDNLIRLEARKANTEGNNEVSIAELIKSALRMRPDRIIVGEVRGFEALSMLQAMNTGHDGSLSTGHANSAKDMLTRLETMVLSGANLPIGAIRGQIASAIDVIIHLGRLSDRSRRVLEISEIVSFDGNEIVLNPLFIRNKDNTFTRTKNRLINRRKAEFSGIELYENEEVLL